MPRRGNFGDGWPEKNYECVCGFDTPHYANLVAHRRKCKSWKEHQDKLDASRQKMAPEPDLAPSSARSCPYCGDERGGDHAMVVHIRQCPKAKEELPELDSLSRSQIEFEVWCVENDRA